MAETVSKAIRKIWRTATPLCRSPATAKPAIAGKMIGAGFAALAFFGSAASAHTTAHPRGPRAITVTAAIRHQEAPHFAIPEIREESRACYGDTASFALTNLGAIIDGMSSNVNCPIHPASTTKVMTILLTLEAIRDQKLRLDTPLHISAHAASMERSKLDLRAGDTITVREALKGVAVDSANDAAVVLAEGVAGSEANFARLMTERAHQLGARNTTFANASGLPNPDQWTTAQDLALLFAHAVNEFPGSSAADPGFLDYLAIPHINVGGRKLPNHNRLLAQGIIGKTGLIERGGHVRNFVGVETRDGKSIIAVTLGNYRTAQVTAQTTRINLYKAFAGYAGKVLGALGFGKEKPHRIPPHKQQTAGRLRKHTA